MPGWTASERKCARSARFGNNAKAGSVAGCCCVIGLLYLSQGAGNFQNMALGRHTPAPCGPGLVCRGMRWATASSRHNIECARWLAQVSPDMVLAAGAVPSLKASSGPLLGWRCWGGAAGVA